MLPLKLRIQGINSYQKEEIIEFSNLLESKIFGIFGEVGSGKSTILEAISYVLYGKYERLKGEKVSYNLMNLKSNRFVIDFEFLVENDNRYRFVVEGRRNSKNFDDVTVKRSRYVWIDNKWEPREDLDAKELIGLSFENFNRTIIIPQGRFMEFINLSGTDRTKMLKEIFNLYKYDLLDKVGMLQSQNNNELSNLAGKLSQLDDITKDIIEENNKALEIVLKQHDEKKKELQLKEKDFKLLEKIKKDYQRLGELDKIHEELLLKEPEFLQNEKKLKEYELCVLNFKSDFDRLYEIEQNITNTGLKKLNLEKKVENTEEKYSQIKNKFDQLSIEIQNLDKLKKESNDYDIILNIKNDENAVKDKEKALSQAKKEFEELKKINEARQNEILDLKKKISEKNKNLPDISLLAEIKNWFLQAQTMQKAVLEIINSLTNRRMSYQRLKNSISDIFDAQDIKTLKIDTTLELDSVIKQLENNIEKWKNGLNNLNKEKDEIALKDKLKEYAHSLEDGKPCPVCGSTEHPNPIEIKNLDKELENIKIRIQKGEALIEMAREYLDKLKELRSTIANEEKNIKEEEAKHLEKKNQYDEFIKSFKWKDYSVDSPEEVNLAFSTAKQMKDELGKLQESFEKIEKQSLKGLEEQDSISKKVALIENELSAMNSKRETLVNQLKVLSYRDFEGIGKDSIQNKKAKLDKRIQEISSEYEKTGQEKKNLELELTELKTELKNINQNLKDSIENKSGLEKKVNNMITDLGFKGIDEVKQILNKKLDVEQIKESINNFKIKLETTKRERDILKEKLQDNTFDQEKYHKVKEEIDRIKELIVSLIEEKSRLKNLVKEQKSKLNEKEKFLKEKEERELRAEDLKLMRSLFTGNGFVNFISTVRLQEVVNYANSRFMKLTRGKMKLELNDDNSFSVIDFLNDGKTRSIKSLSGGQTFQASLSLALALASIVQQQNKSNQNFFFLDEGFGTQDEESLRLVFDTIKSLRKENRIVGLISHVNQLKEEVNTYLDVVHDQNTGSYIVKSWE